MTYAGESEPTGGRDVVRACAVEASIATHGRPDTGSVTGDSPMTSVSAESDAIIARRAGGLMPSTGDCDRWRCGAMDDSGDKRNRGRLRACGRRQRSVDLHHATEPPAEPRERGVRRVVREDGVDLAQAPHRRPGEQMV